MSRERIVYGLVGIAVALLDVLVLFGLPLTDAQEGGISTVLTLIAALVVPAAIASDKNPVVRMASR